ncbi:hypothetical protein [Moorena sp. SIO3A2]|uniref:hypothetical protein n=1 Tax=Moorena sp. SIO3A2 TaxID=2607841 RepID=UPI0013B95A17|nr:hypothetical protein [Moorena sp. SIO3A2]NER91559.1 hypothetical protein [Moorena sp. SIO3A2]
MVLHEFDFTETLDLVAHQRFSSRPSFLFAIVPKYFTEYLRSPLAAPKEHRNLSTLSQLVPTGK